MHSRVVLHRYRQRCSLAVNSDTHKMIIIECRPNQHLGAHVLLFALLLTFRGRDVGAEDILLRDKEEALALFRGDSNPYRDT